MPLASVSFGLTKVVPVVADAHGKLVALYPFGTGWDALAADLERLL